MVTGGHIQIALERGDLLPAYWSHPDVGGRFPGIVLLHDWWGITETERRLSTRFAQAGYYVIVPDLFDGAQPTTPQEAMEQVEQLGAHGYGYFRADAALQVLETHHRCNRHVAAVGLGMGGTLAFQAAVTRTDLEASVVYYGFPQRLLGQLSATRTPILAVYGSDEPHVPTDVIDQLRGELGQSALGHRVVVIEGVGRDFFNPNAPADVQARGEDAWLQTLDFLDDYLAPASRTESPLS